MSERGPHIGDMREMGSSVEVSRNRLRLAGVKQPMSPRRVTVAVLLVALTGVTGCGSQRHLISWVDIVKHDGVTYVAHRPYDQEASGLSDSDLGPVAFRTRFRVSGKVYDPDYTLKDGDATFLPQGTSVYSVVGFSPRFRLAVKRAGRIGLYEADTNPAARRGADLLDLRDKVTRIGVNSERDGRTELGAISDAAAITHLVELVLAAEVDQHPRDSQGARYLVAFFLGDDEPVVRAYSLETGELSRGIMTPPAFGAALKLAVVDPH